LLLDRIEAPWRANKLAATALLARVKAQIHSYQDALIYANEVLQSGLYELLEDYNEIFNRNFNSSEDIFTVQMDQNNAMQLFFASDIVINKNYIDAIFEKNDERRELFNCYSDFCITQKWKKEDGNISLIRLAEMHLIRAECNYILNTEVGVPAIDDINLLRARANLPPLESLSSFDAIIIERLRELGFEGFSIHDKKRLGISVLGFPYNDPKLVFPIPLTDILLNSNLEQNPGY
jgi:hypothetical protein